MTSNEYFFINKKLLRFSEHFTLIRERTGAHIKYGDIFSEKVFFPKKLKNHQISEFLFDYFELNE